MSKYNLIAEACNKLTSPLKISFILKGIPTTEDEWKEAYSEQIGTTEDNISIMSTDQTKWQITWAQIEVEMVKLKTELPLQEIRIERNHRLTDTDWVVARATETSTPVPYEWRQYRQALRDITKTATSPDDVVWPTKPS